MRCVRPAIAILGCVIAGSPSGAQAPATPKSFVVAVVLGESLLPLARYESGGWLNTWPGPDFEAPVPALADVPTTWLGRFVPRNWTVWFPGGATASVEVAGIEHVVSDCQASPLLTLRERLYEPRSGFDFGASELATTGGATVGAIHRLQSAPKDVLRRIRPAVAALFTQHERRVLEEPSGYHLRRAGVTGALLSALSPKIEWLYRPAASTSVVYFEASKRAPTDAVHRLTVRGWLRLDRGRVVPMGIEAQGRYDDSVGPNGESAAFESDRIPLGAVQADGRSVWVMERHAGETFSFHAYDFGLEGVRELWAVDGGGC